jgi:peroxiredoxin
MLLVYLDLVTIIKLLPMRTRFLALFAILIVCVQCKTEKKQDAEPETTTSGDFAFIANPVEVPHQEVHTLQPGDRAPDFRLPGTDGRYHSLGDYADAEVLLIIFTCNHCPTAQAYEERIMDIAADYTPKGVQLIAISPNSPLGLLYEELGYSDLGDTYDEMVIRAKDMGYNFPYLYDGDNQKIALAYGPVATPHAFVFDKERVLRYVGRIDGSEKPGTAHGEDLRLALDQVLAGNPVSTPVTKTFGCSTKWGWKTSMREKVDKEWEEKEVALRDLDIPGVEKLFKNEGEKLRLINIWATWCGPCRLEYPEFIILQRMFGSRDFEFVSLSADKISKKDNALEFLKSAHSAVPNYIASTDDNYALIEAVDPEWNGALPYTVLIEPGGKVVWRHQGEADFPELKKTIVEHPMIGRVY